MKRVEQYKVPVLAGVIPLKSAGMAKFMNKNVAGVSVPQAMIDRISKAEDKIQDRHRNVRRTDQISQRYVPGRPHHGHRLGEKSPGDTSSGGTIE